MIWPILEAWVEIQKYFWFKWKLKILFSTLSDLYIVRTEQQCTLKCSNETDVWTKPIHMYRLDSNKRITYKNKHTHNSNQFDELQKNPTLTAGAITNTATHDMYRCALSKSFSTCAMCGYNLLILHTCF